MKEMFFLKEVKESENPSFYGGRSAKCNKKN
jgi:hypothetical protein